MYLLRNIAGSAVGLLLLAVFASPAMAWGKFGHVTVCEIAYRESTPIAREMVTRLIAAHGEHTSFNRACLVADRFPRTRPSAHFVNYPREQETVVDEECGTGKECVISAIEDDFIKLADQSLSDAERGLALVLLGHWVGDIHQPLHVSFADDRGGNKIDKSGKCSADNLHAVWDNCIVERKVLTTRRKSNNLGWSRFTRAYRAADELQTQISDIQREQWPASKVWEWAAESYEIVRLPEVKYCELRDGLCAYSDGSDLYGPGVSKRNVQIDDEYLERFAPLVETQLMKAGVRLAAMINGALDPE